MDPSAPMPPSGGASIAAGPGSGAKPAPPVQAPWTESFEERCLVELVAHSKALRWPMTSSAVVIAALAATQAPIGWVAAWLVLTLLVRELRAAALLRLEPPSPAPIDARLRQTIAWTLALGIAHGSASLLMLRMDTTFGAVLTMILMSLSAGAVSTTFTVPKAFLAYSGSIAIPSASIWFLRLDWLGLGVGALALMFLLVQLRFARRNRSMLLESFEIRRENTLLLAQLSRERAEIAQARDVAVQANLSKSQFLAAASHDLRQPLQSLSLNGSVLAARELDAETAEIVKEMSTEIDALRQMLDALLDVSKLDAGVVRPELRVVRLDPLLAGLATRLRAAAHAKGIEINCSCEVGAEVHSDPDMLLRLVSNLLDNALKFTQAGCISVSARRVSAVCEVAIADTGRGIPEADLDRIFEDLVQLHNEGRDRSQGHGLGLGIVRRIASLLGITYRIESQVGVGTRFVLALPAHGVVPPASPSGTPVPAMPTARSGALAHVIGRRILVVEDDPGVRRAYERAVLAMGGTPLACANADEAIDVALRHPVDAAILDLRLGGGGDGLEALAAIRASCASLPAAIVSADLSPQLESRASAMGVRLARKPIAPQALEDLLAALLALPGPDTSATSRAASPGNAR